MDTKFRLPAFYLLGWDVLVQNLYKQSKVIKNRFFVHRARAADKMVPLVSNGHTISSLIARPCLILSTRPKQQKRNVFKGCDNYCYSAFELWELSNCLSFDGKFKTQSMHCCKQREKITEVPQFKRTITVERSICKITVVIYILDQHSYKK